MLKIFIGYDHRQIVSYTVLQQSILDRTTKPVAIVPLKLPTLPLKRQGLTPFTYSRFLVPYLCDYKGWALFLDADMLLMADVAELFELADASCDVMVVKNNIRFEWASAMLFNNERCQKLTPEYVETADKLHWCEWAENIGALPPEWNHLVGYDPPREDAKIVHFTQGIPCFPETKTSEYGNAWNEQLKRCMSTIPWMQLIGNSIHAKPVLERLENEHKDLQSI